MSSESTIALGVPVFQRTEKLRQLLNSVDPEFVDTVYVADNGKTETRQELYGESFGFELNALDVEYDSGLGNCRRSIVEALTEDYLFVVDSDHVMPANADTLVRQLESRRDLGGISAESVDSSSKMGHSGAYVTIYMNRDPI